jgi:hypothetical protein
MFLGGAVRRLDDSRSLGFHRFYRSFDPAGLLEVQNNDFDRGLAEAQIISGMVVAYLVEMGVDARLFTAGSTKGRDELIRFEREVAEAMGILTPERFGTWFIEPYRNGIVAASPRQLPTHAYDQVTQATLYCSGVDRTVTLMLTAPRASWLNADSFFDPDHAATITWRIGNNDIGNSEIPASRVAITADEDGAQIRIRLTNREVKAVTESAEFGAVLRVPRVSGGYSFNRALLKDDDKLLVAAVRHCI